MVRHKTKESMHRLIASLVGGEKGCLDVGYGQHPNLFLKEAIGVDIQRNKVSNYKEVYTVNLNKQKLPFKEGRFKIVIAADIIEHVENPSFLLREINRVLKDEGRLIISTPSATYYWDVLRNTILNRSKDVDKGQHLSEWTIMGFIRLLKLNGFKVRKMYGSHLNIPFFNLRLKRIDLNISTIRFPRISYQVVYDCVKIDKPKNRIFTRKGQAGYNYNFDEWIEIENRKVKKDEIVQPTKI